MAKGDYKNSNIKSQYKNKVRKQTLTKVVVDSDEKRDRAELLDMIEELFQNNSSGSITAETLRAFCHILVKSVANSSDDVVVVLDSNTISSLPTSDPRSSGKLWNDRGTVKVSR